MKPGIFFFKGGSDGITIVEPKTTESPNPKGNGGWRLLVALLVVCALIVGILKLLPKLQPLVVVDKETPSFFLDTTLTKKLLVKIKPFFSPSNIDDDELRKMYDHENGRLGKHSPITKVLDKVRAKQLLSLEDLTLLAMWIGMLPEKLQRYFEEILDAVTGQISCIGLLEARGHIRTLLLDPATQEFQVTLFFDRNISEDLSQEEFISYTQGIIVSQRGFEEEYDLGYDDPEGLEILTIIVQVVNGVVMADKVITQRDNPESLQRYFHFMKDLLMSPDELLIYGEPPIKINPN